MINHEQLRVDTSVNGTTVYAELQPDDLLVYEQISVSLYGVTVRIYGSCGEYRIDLNGHTVNILNVQSTEAAQWLEVDESVTRQMMTGIEWITGLLHGC